MADFFNKVLVGINKGVNSVSENSKLFIEKNRINSAIKEQESRKSINAQQLGMMVYQMCKDKEIENDKFNDFRTAIDSANNEIKILNIQLINLQNMANSNVANNTYTENVTPQPQAGIETVQCSCGYINRKSAAFCTACGAKLNDKED